MLLFKFKIVINLGITIYNIYEVPYNYIRIGGAIVNFDISVIALLQTMKKLCKIYFCSDTVVSFLNVCCSVFQGLILVEHT